MGLPCPAALLAAALLPAVTLAQLPVAPPLDVRSVARTWLPARPLAVAFMGHDRIVVLSAEDVALYRGEGAALVAVARRALPGPLEPVRAPGGLLQVAAEEGAFWALTSRSPRAVLFVAEGDALSERQQADALPWPTAPAGLRFRAGTNLIEGSPAGLGDGPFLALTASEGGLAVTAEGRLLVAGTEAPLDIRLGPTLASVYPGTVGTARAVAPGQADALVLLARNGALFTPAGEWPVDQAVRALAADPRGDSVRLALGLEGADGRGALLVVDLPRGTP